MRSLATILLLFLMTQLAHAQLNRWSFDDLDSLQAVEERDVMVFLKADWCRYCKVMENSVFQDESISRELNESYWLVTFDGESERPVSFLGKTYQFRPTGLKTGIHELAGYLGEIDGKIAFPTLVVLKPEGEIVFQYSSFLNKKQMLLLMRELAAR